MTSSKTPRPAAPGQVVLVLQGGGALGAYQLGCYQALHEAGIEPDWVIGTSIGAINAALITGNAPEDRLVRLRLRRCCGCDSDDKCGHDWPTPSRHARSPPVALW